MTKTLIVISFWSSLSAMAVSEIRDVIIDGEGVATTKVQCLGCDDRAPTVRIQSNQIELTWADAQLAEKHHGKLEITDPHPLISRLSLFSSEPDSVKGVITVRGSTEDLERRVHVSNNSNGSTLQLAFPNGTSEALALLRHQEDAPLKAALDGQNIITPRFGGFQWMGLLAVILLAGATSFFGARWIKTKGKLSGSRKFLIEKVAQVPLDAKASVCLLKVGGELVLVGVTGQNVSFLSSMPRLQEQYDSESGLERRAFKDAVEEEFLRIKSTPSLAA